MNEKLSKTQMKCIEQMKQVIDVARTAENFEDWLIKTHRFYANQDDPLKYIEDHRSYCEPYRKYYDNYKKGIVLVGGYGKPTLNALEKRGIVTVIEYDEYRSSGVIDWVKLNNY